MSWRGYGAALAALGVAAACSGKVETVVPGNTTSTGGTSTGAAGGSAGSTQAGAGGTLSGAGGSAAGALTGGAGGSEAGTGGVSGAATGGTGAGAGGAAGLDAGVDASDGDSGGAPGECVAVRVGDLTLDSGQSSFARYAATIVPGSGVEGELVLESYLDETGAIDLGTAAQSSYTTCTQCVFVRLSDGRIFLQESGQLTLAGDSQSSLGVLRGDLSGLQLTEVTLDLHTSESTSVPGGACVQVADLAFDTAATSTPCTTAQECVALNPAASCDPRSLQCSVASTCSALGECGLEGICTAQSNITAACYPRCILFDDESNCVPGQHCVPLNVRGDGYCKAEGSAAPGELCTEGDTTTGCADGSQCLSLTGAPPASCFQNCDPWSPTPGCAADELCTAPNSFCVDAAPFPLELGGLNAAAIGEPCISNEFRCGVLNDSTRGGCYDLDFDGNRTCMEFCEPHLDACSGADEVCARVFDDATVGLCLSGCDYWSSQPACPSGEACALGRAVDLFSQPFPEQTFCLSLAFINPDPAAVGDPCAMTSLDGSPCAFDGFAARGQCAFGTCVQMCRIGSSDCGGGQTCTDLSQLGFSVGSCL